MGWRQIDRLVNFPGPVDTQPPVGVLVFDLYGKAAIGMAALPKS